MWGGRAEPTGFGPGMQRQPKVFWLGRPVQLGAEVDHTSARKQDPSGGGEGRTAAGKGQIRSRDDPPY